MDIYYSNMGSVKFNKNEIKKIPILTSYYGINKNYTKPEFCSKLMLDSGAYSASRKKIVINIKDFIDYINKTKINFKHIVCLDVFGDDKTSYKNYLTMKKNGIESIPVFHIGADKKYLYNYVDETNYIGLGGVANLHYSKRIMFLRKIFQEFNDPQKISFHGFGINDENIIKMFPWESVDASSAHIIARYGGIYTPYGMYKINPKVNFKELKWKTELKENIISKYLSSIGINYTEASLNNTTGTKERCKANIIYYENIKKLSPNIYNNKIETLL